MTDKLDKQVYLRNMDDVLAAEFAKLKGRYNIKSSVKLVEKVILNHFPLVSEIEKLKLENSNLKVALDSERYKHNEILIKMRAYFNHAQNMDEIKMDLLKPQDFNGQ